MSNSQPARIGVLPTAPASPLSPWEHYHRRWRALGPPQRPHAEVVASVRTLLAGHERRILMLGVTPELADIGTCTLAVDRSAGAIAEIWPGDTATRRAIRGEWQGLPCTGRAFSAAVGDGALNCLAFPGGYVQVFDQLARSVQAGGRLVLRVYLTPSPCESLADVRTAVMDGAVASAHALKWRIAMALCSERRNPNLDVREIPRAFDALFPSRLVVMRATGWTEETLAQIDVYAALPDVYSFPALAQINETLPSGGFHASWHASGRYELAERCPLLVLDVASAAAVG